MRMNIQRRRVPLIPLLIVGLAGCGSSGGQESETSGGLVSTTTVTIDSPQQVTAFCGKIKQWAELNRQEKDVDRTSMEHIRNLDKQIDLFHTVPSAAPASISDAMRTIASVRPDAVMIADSEKRTQADNLVDDFIAKQCGVAFSFKGYDFSPS